MIFYHTKMILSVNYLVAKAEKMELKEGNSWIKNKSLKKKRFWNTLKLMDPTFDSIYS